ncbi:MAG: hypothetical protein SFW62_03500 [Alphaproteobacteria bacterium]|nr:hypothetical protein [Alphaproteobacteria bacterium]
MAIRYFEMPEQFVAYYAPLFQLRRPVEVRRIAEIVAEPAYGASLTQMAVFDTPVRAAQFVLRREPGTFTFTLSLQAYKRGAPELFHGGFCDVEGRADAWKPIAGNEILLRQPLARPVILTQTEPPPDNEAFRFIHQRDFDKLIGTTWVNSYRVINELKAARLDAELAHCYATGISRVEMSFPYCREPVHIRPDNGSLTSPVTREWRRREASLHP